MGRTLTDSDQTPSLGLGPRPVTFYYEGSVQPDAVPLTLDYEPQIMRREAADSPDAEYRITVFMGRVRIRVRTDKFNASVADALFTPAWNLAQSFLSTYGFIRAIPYTVTIERMIAPDGKVLALALDDRSVARTHGFVDADLQALSDLTMLDMRTSMVVNDLLMTIGRLDYSPIACGRVADSLARLIAPDDERAAQWAALRAALRVDEAFVRSLSDVSKASRHGDRIEVPAVVNNATAHRAWKLVGRYLRLKLDGYLAPEKFPILKG